MLQRCRNLGGLVARMEEIREGAAAAFQKRPAERLAELLQGVAIDPQRLAQEAALLADRSDIAEELAAAEDARRRRWRKCWRAAAKWASGWIFCCRK